MYELINDIADLLNSIGKNLPEGGESYLWESGWKQELQRDFQHVLDNLHRGEMARLADISVTYNRKLYNGGNHDIDK